MDYLSNEPTFEQVVLDRVRVGASAHVPSYVLRNLEVEQLADYMTDSLVYHFRSEVLARTLSTESYDKTVTWQTPASWWQMFKATYALSWWLSWFVDRWPVRYEAHAKTVTFEVKQQAVFPEANIQFPPSLGNPVIVNRVS